MTWLKLTNHHTELPLYVLTSKIVALSEAKNSVPANDPDDVHSAGLSLMKFKDVPVTEVWIEANGYVVVKESIPHIQKLMEK